MNTKIKRPDFSIWEKEAYFDTDIIIVGAGLVGLWSAFFLKLANPKVRITILERGIIPTGASTRNAGFACFGSATEILSDKRKMGDDALETAMLRYRGIQKIKSILGESAIGYDPCGGYEMLSGKIHNISALSDEINLLNKEFKHITNSENTFSVSRDVSRYGFNGFDAMVSNPFEGGLHSGKLVNALMSKVQSMGVQILFATNVRKINDKSNFVLVHTDSMVLGAKKVVLCTNAFTDELIRGLKITPARGQILVTSSINGLPWKGTFHFDEGYYYFRNIGNRVLLGGARNKFFKEEETKVMETSDQVQDALEDFLKERIIPGHDFEIEHRWSGIMAFTENKKPLIYNRPSGSIYSVVACNGMGVAMAPIVAEELSKRMNF